MDAEFLAEVRRVAEVAYANGWMTRGPQVQVSVRSKYRSVRSLEDEFEFQKKKVAALRKQLASARNPRGEKMKPVRIRLGMAEARLESARKAMGIG